PSPTPGPATRPQEQKDSVVWYYYPAPCGSCVSGWYYPVRVNGAGTSNGSLVRNSPPPRRQADPKDRYSPGSVEEPARSGDEVALVAILRQRESLSTQGLAGGDAPELFWKGYRLYWQRDYTEALRYFEAATRLADNDARFWYY